MEENILSYQFWVASNLFYIEKKISYL